MDRILADETLGAKCGAGVQPAVYSGSKAGHPLVGVVSHVSSDGAIAFEVHATAPFSRGFVDAMDLEIKLRKTPVLAGSGHLGVRLFVDEQTLVGLRAQQA